MTTGSRFEREWDSELERTPGKSNRAIGIAHIRDPEKREIVAKRADASVKAFTIWSWEKREHNLACDVCTSPDREEIEKEFKDWVGLADLEKYWDISRDVLKRHFRVKGLYRERESNRAGPFREIIRKGMQQLHKGLVDITVRDMIQANNSLVQMEGGFKVNVELSGRIEQVASEYVNLPIEQLDAVMDEMIMRLANPGRNMGATRKVIDVKAQERTDGEYDDSGRDGVPDPAATRSEGSSGDQ